MVSKLLDEGFSVEDVECRVDTAYELAYRLEERVEFQAYLQGFVDNAISSTINVPSYEAYGEFRVDYVKESILPYLEELRGLTIYPDGGVSGQPLKHITLADAISGKGTDLESEIAQGVECKGGVCSV